MGYIPNQQWILVDGRHRFVEYEKFEPDAKEIPILGLNSDFLKSAIMNKTGFIAYNIQSNLYLMNTTHLGKWKGNITNIKSLL